LALSVLVNFNEAFTVRVFGAVVTTRNGVQLISTQDIDLSSYVPATGALYASIESDDDGDLSVHVGDVFPSPVFADVAYVAPPDEGKYLVAFVLLYESMEELLDEHVAIPFPLGINFANFVGTEDLEYQLGMKAHISHAHAGNLIYMNSMFC